MRSPSLLSTLNCVLIPKTRFTYTNVESGVVLVHLAFSLITDCEDFWLFWIDIKGACLMKMKQLKSVDKQLSQHNMRKRNS